MINPSGELVLDLPQRDPELVLGQPVEDPLLPRYASLRADRAQYSMPNRSYDDIYEGLVTGKEQDLRMESAYNEKMEREINKQNMIADISKKGVNPQTLQFLVDTYDVAMASPDPQSVWEEKVGKVHMAQLKQREIVNGSDEVTADVKLQRYLDTYREMGSTLIAKSEYALTKKQDAINTYQKQSWLGWGADQAKMLVPFYIDYKLRGQVEAVSKFYGLLGTNLEAQVQHMLSLPMDQYKATFTKIMSDLMGSNPSMAVMFADAVTGQSDSQVVLNNVFNTIDFVTLPIYKASKAAIGALRGTREATEATVKAAAKSTGEPSHVSIPAAVGDLGEAATMKVSTGVVDSIKGLSGDEGKRAIDALTSHLQVDRAAIAKNPGRYGADIVNRITENYDKLIARISTTLDEVIRVERTPMITKVAESVRAVKEEIKSQYPHLNNAIMDITDPVKVPATNTYFMNMNLGRLNGEFFSSALEAEGFARLYGVEGARIAKGTGDGWMLQIQRGLPETSHVTRDFLLSIKSAESPESMAGLWTSWLAKVVTPDQIMSLEANMNRKVSTYAPSKFLQIMKENVEDIHKLRSWTLPGTRKKQRWNEWKRVVDEAKRLHNEATGKPGLFFDNPTQLDDFYQRTLARSPDPQEVAAYFSYKSSHEIDGVLRDIAMLRNKLREGAELHRFWTIGENGKRLYSDHFDAARMAKLPERGDDTVFVVGKNEGDGHIYSIGNKEFQKQYAPLVKTGEVSALRIIDPGTKPLHGYKEFELGGYSPKYVVVHNLESQPLPYQQVPRQGGGHFEYDYNWYIKQARITLERMESGVRTWYEGDATIMPIAFQKMGKDVAEKLDNVRQLIKDGKRDDAKAYALTNIPAIEWKVISGWFRERKIDGVKQPAMLNLDEKIQIVERNKMLWDEDATLRSKPNIQDRTKQSFQDRVQFTGERDARELFTLRNEGTKYNPIYAVEPAKLVDPMTTMERSLSRIIHHGPFMDDYKMFSVEHWLQEAKAHLRFANDRDVFSNAFYQFHHGVLDDSPKAAQLEAQRYQIKQLLGVPSKFDTFIHSAAQSLADSVYEKWGPKWAGSALDPSWTLPYLKDPFGFIRSVTFHTTLGMGNIAQFLVQNQTFAMIAAISGTKYAIPGAKATLFHQMARLNPGMVDKLDEMASSFRFIPGTSKYKPGEFKEAYDTLHRTGFENVAGEYAARDTSQSIIRHNGKEFLNLAAVFFREGERNVRLGAWYTAFKEFRDKVPSGRLTDSDVRQILNRADNLSINMSRASSSMLHTGVFSIPSQFLSYQLRLAELFMSKRIGDTTWERTLARSRMVAWTAGLYGVPTVAGLTGMPLQDYWRKYAMENGYVVGENWWRTMVEEGIPSLMLGWATGKGDTFDERVQTGLYFNVSDRFGIQGFESIREALRSDQPWYRLAGGASFNKIGGALSAMDPWFNAVASIWRDDDKYFQITPEHLIAPFREISAINTGVRAWMAYQTGIWLSKKGAPLTADIGLKQNIFMSITGLQPQEVADSHLLGWSNQDKEKAWRAAEKQFVNEWGRGLRAYDAGNHAEGTDAINNAISYLRVVGYPDSRMDSAFAKAFKGRETLVERTQHIFLQKNVPEEQRAARQKAYEQINEARRKRQ